MFTLSSNIRCLNTRTCYRLQTYIGYIKSTIRYIFQDVVGTSDIHIQVRPPGRHIVTYTMQLADERLLAPMAVFHPDMFGLQKAVHVLRVAEKYRSDPSDPYDDDYLVQTQSRHEQVQLTLSSPTVCTQYPPQMCKTAQKK